MRIIQSLKLFNPKTFRTVFAFCQNRDIAIISSKIIDMIQNQQKEDTKCLGLKITQLNIKDFPEKYPIQPQNLQNIKKMFTIGVQLPRYYLKEERILKALKAGQGENNTSQSLFVFYPTWITTTHVFKYMRQKKPLSLFIGNRGVGKTASFILYSMLMNNITKYVMNNKEAAKKLIQDKTIRSPEKVIYWSFKDYIQQGIIIDQCSQMFDDNVFSRQYTYLLELQEQNLRLLSKKISEFYTFKSPLKTVIIIDQIKELVQLYRKHNAMKSKGYFTKQQQFFRDSLNNINIQNKIRQDISSMGNYKIYISSVNIQKSLILTTDRSNPFEEHMILNQEQNLDFPKLNYQLRVYEEKAKEQTLHYIGMEYKRYFASLTESQIQEEMKKWNMPLVEASAKRYSENAQLTLEHNQRQKLLNEKVQIIKDFIKPDIQFALPLLFVRYNFDSKVKYQPAQFKNRIKEYYKQKLKQFSYFINNISLFDKADRQRITEIIIFIKTYVLSLDKQVKMIVINRQRLFQQMKYMFSVSDKEEIIDKYMDPSVFPYSDQIKGYTCQIPRNIMEHQLIRLTLSKNNYETEIHHFRTMLHKDKSQIETLFGQKIKSYITTAMIQCGKQKGVVRMQDILRQIVAKGKFYQFNLPNDDVEEDKPNNPQKQFKLFYKNQKINEELYLKGKMSQMIQIANNNKNQFCFGLPYPHKMETQSISKASYCADFCLVQYTPDKPQPYEFIFVDIESGNDLNFLDLNKKAEQFKRRLQLSLKSSNIKYNVQVIVLCRKKCQNPKEFPQIVLVDISRVTFIVQQENCDIARAQQILKILNLV